MRILVVAFCAGALLAALPSNARADDGAIKSPSELAGGAVITTLGGASLLGGVALLVASSIFSSCGFCGDDARSFAIAGVPLAIGGAIAAAGGIWMIHDGVRRQPRWAFFPALSPRAASLGFVATF